MRRGMTKADVVSMTKEMITRQGMRGIRVDDIAQHAGMSKRTLYEMFGNKTNLFKSCLEELWEEYKQKIAEYVEQDEAPVIDKIFRLLDTYINGLYVMDHEFVVDISRCVEFKYVSDSHIDFWSQIFVKMLRWGISQGYFLRESNIELIVRNLVATAFEFRVQGRLSQQEQYSLACCFLRGCAAPEGIEWIDRQRDRRTA
ncbi:MAG: TetR/AcrR family transcriptional regulator [Rikenellaceae bacterium]|nr:TetR/AcrR family transcriptional regulator [Rikenellaceae bacterium]